jgi:hypothetical protein
MKNKLKKSPSKNEKALQRQEQIDEIVSAEQTEYVQMSSPNGRKLGRVAAASKSPIRAVSPINNHDVDQSSSNNLKKFVEFSRTLGNR